MAKLYEGAGVSITPDQINAIDEVAGRKPYFVCHGCGARRGLQWLRDITYHYEMAVAHCEQATCQDKARSDYHSAFEGIAACTSSN